MSGPVLVACLVALRTEFNELAPHRDKGADGWIGDAAHQQESSDHNPDETGRTPYEDADHINEVHALDVDKDLGGGLDLDEYVDRIVVAHRADRDNRLQNVIWQGYIASRSWGWTWQAYSGPSKHFDHAHFSARYTTAQENDTRPWGVYQQEDIVTPEDIDKIADAVTAKVLTAKLGKSTVTVAQSLQGTEIQTRGLADDVDAILAAVKPAAG